MLRAVYITGSWCFLKNARDIDVVYVYDTKEEAKEALKNSKKDHRYCEHWEGLDEMPRIYLGCYIYPFRKLIRGEDLHFEQYSIFDFKEEYLALLKKYAEWLPKENKWWYHILTACYMFENGSYELTEKQLEAIQRAHDKGITDAKYNYCLKQLGVVS